MKILSFFSLIIVLGLTACKTTCTMRNQGEIYFHNFDSSDARIITITEYAPDRQFSHVLNSFSLSDTTLQPTIVFSHYGNVTEGIPVSPNVDLLVGFPLIGKTYKITGRNVNHDKEATRHCSSSYSYYRNDTPQTYPVEPLEGGSFIIDIYK